MLLFMLVPRAVALPSTRQLQEAKDALEKEVVERKRVESELRQAHALLEVRVQERTAALQEANDRLETQSTELRESDRRKDEFLAILSHELRNPVHAIRMGVGYLKISNADAEIQETCSTLERQVANLSRLLDDLLSVLKQKRGETELEMRPTDVREVVGAAMETASPLIEQRRQTLDVRLSTEPLGVQADGARLAQALTNLLTNASTYSEAYTAIRLEATLDGGHVRIAVTDCGIGFDEDERGRLFDLFSRGRRAKALFTHGLGIGLHLAREIVAGHGGRLEAYSEGPGRGSRFEIWLPLLLPATADRT
jgi:signal transduction histidine kinase